LNVFDTQMETDNFMSRKQTILAVDDNPTNIKLLEGILGDKYKVLVAYNGADAIEACYNESVDLILLDIMMPEMDGYEVCRRIKKDPSIRHIPVIFVTARHKTEDIVKGFEVGGVDYVTKPFNAAELSARIKTHIEMKELRGLLPICSECKNIRDDKGYWKKIETYIEEHSDAQFSHDVCSDCAKKLYPELVDEDGNFIT